MAHAAHAGRLYVGVRHVGDGCTASGDRSTVPSEATSGTGSTFRPHFVSSPNDALGPSPALKAAPPATDQILRPLLPPAPVIGCIAWRAPL